jgi:hypothetical protein
MTRRQRNSTGVVTQANSHRSNAGDIGITSEVGQVQYRYVKTNPLRDESGRPTPGRSVGR